jgi:hypothetical protein
MFGNSKGNIIFKDISHITVGNSNKNVPMVPLS